MFALAPVPRPPDNPTLVYVPGVYPSPISKLKSRAPNGSDTTTPPSSNPIYDASKSVSYTHLTLPTIFRV